jgi:hypothetical protein
MAPQTGLGLVALASAALLLGCSGASGVGEQKTAGPIAWSKALNQPFSGTNGDISLSVRAGADVFLTGRDSTGVVAPVLSYRWTSTKDPATGPLVLLKRNESTVSFRAPQTTIDTDLQLKLTVTDSNGATDDALVTVKVIGVPDPDAFLSYGGARSFTFAAVTNAVASLATDVPFNVTVERRVSYRDLNGQQQDDLLLETKSLAGGWLAAYGTGGTSSQCGSAANPRFTVPMPGLNADDVLAQVGVTHPERVLDPAYIDDAVVTVRLTLTPSTALPPGVTAGICVAGIVDPTPLVMAKPARAKSVFSAAADGISTQASFTLDELLRAWL